MNAPDKFTSLLSLTREPFPASHKCLIPGSRPDLNVLDPFAVPPTVAGLTAGAVKS